MNHPFVRAFVIVTLTALNVTQISGGHIFKAFFSGSALSFVWWANTRTASKTDGRAAQLYYALGAGCGTMFGMFLGRLF